MKALILAAGYATRLYPLTKHWPKPLLLIREQPIIAHIIRKVEKLKDLKEIIIITNDKYYHRFEDWTRHSSFKTQLSVLNDGTISEDDRLGAIGDINFVINNYTIDDDLLVIGGDNLFTFGLKKFIKFAKTKPQECIVGLYNIKDPSLIKHYGVVTLNEDRKIVRFQEKPKKSSSTLISMCIYYFPLKSLTYLRKYVNSKDYHDTSGDYIKWLHRKTNVWGYEFSGVWHDIGDIITFYHASLTFKDKKGDIL